MIALLKYVQKNPTIPIAPKICSKEHYMDVRENRKAGGGKYSKEYTALIGYCASFGVNITMVDLDKLELGKEIFIMRE